MHLLVYAPILLPDDPRPEAGARAIEAVFPEQKMRFEIDDRGALVAIEDRDERLRDGIARGEMPLLCNGDAEAYVGIDWVFIPPRIGPAGRALTCAMVTMPDTPPFAARTGDLLEQLGDLAGAHWATATPARAAAVIGAQLSPQDVPLAQRTFPLGGLPSLRPLRDLPKPEIPERLGWINYLSAAAAALVGFPDPARDEAWLTRARKTTKGAWLVRLTDEPLDVPTDEAHLATLKAAYARFLGV